MLNCQRLKHKLGVDFFNPLIGLPKSVLNITQGYFLYNQGNVFHINFTPMGTPYILCELPFLITKKND